MGLLNRIETSQQQLSQQTISFFDFVKRFSLPHCAIFTKHENNYVISKSAGFDGDSIVSSFSTTDFWEGSINKGKWTFFSRNNNTIVTILQFFSKSLKDKIEFVGTYFENDTILFVAYDEVILPSAEMTNISKTFKTINFAMPNNILKTSTYKQPVTKLSFNYADAINDFVVNHPAMQGKENITTKIKRTIQAEIEYKAFTLSNQTTDFLKTGEFQIACNVYSKNNMSNAALKSFINLNLKSILGASTNLISYAD